MTQTTDAPSDLEVPEPGLHIRRVWTTKGVNPYDEVVWERRDVVMTDWRTGEIVFEQRGVEFPAFWSVNASNIVTTKYFRGALGTPEREWSLRQLVDRVVRTYRKGGEDHGYFSTKADADAFEQELTWMLLHQVFSFNSPVWFNVGTSSPQQISACFILSVDDSMESILDWYKEEGLIFKGGSGAGVNLSRIRGSMELLSSGGTASGPVSFMRGADASAGTIKSGGATRRAAKMVILDVDHPDVEEFIDLKAREERKIRVLRDAGFDMEVGGKDTTSVQYQNANNSVRVSDAFLSAVEARSTFDLVGRMDGKVVKTVDAKALFRRMAQAAWECADPGLQYDDTINDWHTTPASGRINGSNPCFTGDTWVHTDKGLIRFDELIERSRNGEWFGVYTHDATNPDAPADAVVLTRPKAFMVTGTSEIVRLEFSNGMVLRCTPAHRIWTVNRGYVEAEKLEPSDRVLALNQPTPAIAASYEFKKVASQGRQRTAHHSQNWLPEKWTPEFAHLLGWLVGDGCVGGDTAVWTYGDDKAKFFLDRHQSQLAEIVGFTPKPSQQANGTTQLRATRQHVVDFLAELGVSMGRAADKRIPRAVLQAPSDIQAMFLRGLFDSDGTAAETANGTRYVGLGAVSVELLRDVQRLLTTFGISSRIYTTRPRNQSKFSYTTVNGEFRTYTSENDLHDLRISGQNIPRYAAAIGFDHGRKAQRLADWLNSNKFYKTPQTVTLVSRTFDGVETTYNLSEPRNHSYVANGVVVRNCSEYLSLDNSSCNLASMNLMKFRTASGAFDIEKFIGAVELVITAMDISVAFGDFPTKKITETSKAYRQLGIGYANLGALLMASGLPYDSEEGRAVAAAITSLMTGVAYRRSAELAGAVGPYDGYARNAQSHQRVIRMHQGANNALASRLPLASRIAEAATQEWADCVKLGKRYGYRNAQASLLAPTGTIGFMMDCDTTGIEPDFALVKLKKLVGGSSMQIVNNTIPTALRTLGYQEEQVEAITEYIKEHGHVVDAPGLAKEHYPVFDCAVGERAIVPMGHVRMMAAVQPFLSGAISKTVNMPESATVEEIEDVYFLGWKMGLKAIAVYRDNCKVGQVLNAGGKGAGEKPAAEVVAVTHPTRKRLPKKRSSETVSFAVGGAEGYMTTSAHPDGGLGEVFLKMSKQGSTLAGIMDAFSIAISVGLQYGVPLETYISKFTSMRFEPAGSTDDPDVRMASSLVDYIFRRLALDYLPFEQRAELGIFTAAERIAQVNGEVPATAPALLAPVADASAPLCHTCGDSTRRAGSCHVCENCGSTSGCS